MLSAGTTTTHLSSQSLCEVFLLRLPAYHCRLPTADATGTWGEINAQQGGVVIPKLGKVWVTANGELSCSLAPFPGRPASQRATSSNVQVQISPL